MIIGRVEDLEGHSSIHLGMEEFYDQMLSGMGVFSLLPESYFVVYCLLSG